MTNRDAPAARSDAEKKLAEALQKLDDIVLDHGPVPDDWEDQYADARNEAVEAAREVEREIGWRAVKSIDEFAADRITELERDLSVARRLAEALGIASDADACWEWPLSKNADGYGYIRWGGHRGGETRKAHREALRLFIGDPPDAENTQALHSCDNPSCFRPAHLYWGNPKKNAEDREERGNRSRKGEDNPNARLTARDVEEIHGQLAAGQSRRSIARERGVSATTIDRIARGERWV